MNRDARHRPLLRLGTESFWFWNVQRRHIGVPVTGFRSSGRTAPPPYRRCACRPA
jgi:hypothetical protein